MSRPTAMHLTLMAFHVLRFATCKQMEAHWGADRECVYARIRKLLNKGYIENTSHGETPLIYGLTAKGEAEIKRLAAIENMPLPVYTPPPKLDPHAVSAASRAMVEHVQKTQPNSVFSLAGALA